MCDGWKETGLSGGRSPHLGALIAGDVYRALATFAARRRAVAYLWVALRQALGAKVDLG